MEKELKVRCRECDHPFDARFDIDDAMDYAFCPYCGKTVEINTSLSGQLKPKHVLEKRKKDKKEKEHKELLEKIKKDKEEYEKDKEDKDK